MFRLLAILAAILCCAPCVALGVEDGEPSRTRHIVEIQAGGGILSGSHGTGPIAQVQARFAAWRTIGLGLYAAGSYISEDRVRGVIPVCGRLNLSLPFWQRFEPVFSVGAGGYTYILRPYGGGTKSDTRLGYQAALALLFPHRKHGFGIEGSLHLTDDPYSSDSIGGHAALVVTALLR